MIPAALAKAFLFFHSEFEKGNVMKLLNCQDGRRDIADQVIRFGAVAREQIRVDVQTLIGRSSYQVDADAATMADIGAAAIGKQLLQHERMKLAEFGMGLGEPFIVIEGLPEQADLPPTPQMFHDDAVVQSTDCQLLGAMRLAGLHPVAYTSENYGRLMRNVAPAATALNAVSSHGSKEPLEFHTDNGYEFEGSGCVCSPSPQYLWFAGLRNQDANGNPVPTEVLRVSDIVDQASTTLLTTIQQPIFRIMPGQSNSRAPIDHVPLLERNPVTGEWRLRFNCNGSQTVGLTRDAKHATKELIEQIDSMEELAVSIVVAPGRLLGFDNYRVLHRRSSFEPGEDLSQARWLRRCFACRDLRNGQRIDPRHRPYVWK